MLEEFLRQDLWDEAAEWLEAGRTGDVARLRELVFHPHTELRQRAVRALGLLGDVASVPALADLYARGLDRFDHDYVFDAFRAMGDAAVPALLQVVERGSDWERHGAIQGLGLVGGAAVPFLVDLARDGERIALQALQNVQDPRAVPFLLDVLEHGSEDAAGEASLALSGCCDSTCAEAVEPLLRCLAAGRGSASRLMATLGEIGDLRALPVLAAALRRGGDVAEAAARALRGISHPQAVDALAAALNSKRLSRDAREDVLSSLLAHPCAGPEIRRDGIRMALEGFAASHGREFASLLEEATQQPEGRAVFAEFESSPDPAIRLALSIALAETDPERAGAHFRFAVAQGNPALRTQAAAALPAGADPWPLAADPEPSVRVALARSLEFPPQGIDVEPVLEQLCRDPRWQVRSQAAQALRACDAGALRLIEELADDRSSRVREAAAQELLIVAQTLPTEEWIPRMARFLYDPRGRAVDLYVGCTVREGEWTDHTVSDALAEADFPLARRYLEEWHARGGRRAWPVRRNPWAL